MVTSTPDHECTGSQQLRTMNVRSLLSPSRHLNSRGFFGPIAYIHSTELVWPRKVTFRSRCVLCTLYTDSRIHLADFMFLLYIAQSIVLGFFSSRPNWDPSQPQESVSPLLWFKGGGHKGVTLQSWCGRVKWPYGVKKISMKWLWPVKVTLKVIKRRLKVFCWSCDGVPLKWI